MKIVENFVYSNPKKRIFAFLFDLALIFGVSIILMIPAIVALINVLLHIDQANIIALFFACLISGALVICFSIFYFVCLPVFWDGQTVGKRFCNIRIIDSTTNEGPIAKVMFIREFIRILLFVLTFGLSGIASLISILITHEHVSFHEVLSTTRVVDITNVEDDERETFSIEKLSDNTESASETNKENFVAQEHQEPVLENKDENINPENSQNIETITDTKKTDNDSSVNFVLVDNNESKANETHDDSNKSVDNNSNN